MKKVIFLLVALILSLTLFVACPDTGPDGCDSGDAGDGGGTGQVETPTFSPTTGDYGTYFYVSISTLTSDATIHYTLDSTEPTETSDEFDYNNPLFINSATEIRAKAFKDGSTPSETATAQYDVLWDENKIFPSDGAESDRFGMSVGLSGDGNTVSSGAYLADANSLSMSGKGYILKWNSGTSTWDEDEVLTASDATADDWFGYTISTSQIGETVVVGAHPHESVYVYEWDSTTWVETILTASDGESSDHFGRCVAVSDDGLTIGVGADGVNGSIYETDYAVGAVYVYKWNSGTSSWDETKLHAEGGYGAQSDYFGYNIDISGDGNAVIGGADSVDDTDNYYTDSGAAYLFKWNSGTSSWDETKFVASDRTDGTMFGYNVAVSDDANTVAVTAHNWGGATTDALYIYDWNGSTWDETKIQPVGCTAGMGFGYWVDVSGNGDTVAVSADGNGGSVYVYERNGSNWDETKIIASDYAETNSFGKCLSLSDDGSIMAVGDFFHDGTADNAGTVYVYRKKQ